MIACWVLLAALPSRASTLTLREAARLALERSPEVEAARRRAEEAGLEEPLLLAALDPRLESSYAHVEDRAPRASPAFQGSMSRIDRWDAGFSQRTLLGTEARLAWRNERLLNPTFFRALDPTVDSRLALELRQPLARHFWGRPDKARRSRARAGASAAAAALRREREAAALRAARAVVELGLARDVAAIRDAGVADARRLLATYEEKRRYGLVEDSDILQASVSLEAQETELLIARSQAERAWIALREVLRLEDGRPIETERPAPERLPRPDDEPEAAALRRRSDVEAARLRREALEFGARVERLDTLPEVSLTASYALAGLDSSYGRSWSDMAGGDHAVKSAGLSLAVPIGFKRERLARRAAELRLAVARAEEARARDSALRELRDAREGLALARSRLEARRRIEDLERRKFAAEEANFRRGRSTTDLLLRFQQDIRRAQAELLRAAADEALALLELARSRGTLLEDLAP